MIILDYLHKILIVFAELVISANYFLWLLGIYCYVHDPISYSYVVLKTEYLDDDYCISCHYL